jgi:hypothetical protein
MKRTVRRIFLIRRARRVARLRELRDADTWLAQIWGNP